MGLAIILLLHYAGRTYGGFSRGLGVVLLLVYPLAFGIGFLLGKGTSGDKYTVQVGNRAWSAYDFHDFRQAGVDFDLDDKALVVEGKNYGQVPRGAHVWIREDAVLVNNLRR